MRNTHGFIYPLFLTSKELIYQLFACGLLGIIAYGVIEYFGASQVARLIFRVPTKVLYPTIFLTSFTAAYSAKGSMFDVLVMVLAGLDGYLMRKFDFNVAAFVIAFVLAKGAEETFRQSLLMSDNGVIIFNQRSMNTSGQAACGSRYRFSYLKYFYLHPAH